MLRILAQAAQEGQGSGIWNMLIIMLPMIVLFYFLLIRPQRKQEAQRRAMIDSLRKNDRIVTNGGILGVVTSIKDDEISIRVDDARDVKLKITKNAVAAVVSRKEEKEE